LDYFFFCGATGAAGALFAGAAGLPGAAGCGFDGCLFIVFFSWLESDFHRMSQFTPFPKKEKPFFSENSEEPENQALLNKKISPNSVD
jgi:hypothetical protein